MDVRKWNFYIDTGGTFTDCIGIGPNGLEKRVKVLSRGSLTAKIVKQLSDVEFLLNDEVDWPDSFPVGFKFQSLFSVGEEDVKVLDWNNSNKLIRLSTSLNFQYSGGETIELFSGLEAPLLGMRLILARLNIRQGACSIRMHLATTRCTNALLEKKGTKPAFFVTEGFSDLLDIGDQRRVGLFDAIPQKRKSLTGNCVEVNERTDRDGKVEIEPDLKQIRNTAEKLLQEGCSVAVVSFLNSYKNSKNEKAVAFELSKLGFARIIESSNIYPFVKWLPRSEAAVLEGYLQPILDRYLKNIRDGLGEGANLLIMNSAGGLIDCDDYRAIDSLLSGPAGGVVGSSFVGRRAGIDKMINLDMGGTSTDVSRFSGKYSYQSSLEIGDAHLAGISLNIETVAAGGGSICRVENGRLVVGPESAGAYPGPACYGFGGPFCLTDVNLLLGRLDPNRFPTPICKIPAVDKLNEYVKQTGYSREELLAGFVSIANEAMSRAIRKISLEEGYDPGEHALVSFGGAGGQHICGVANRLGITKILSPADSGLLSAFGLSMSRIERVFEKATNPGMNLLGIIKTEKDIESVGYRELQHYDDIKVLRKTASVRMNGQEIGLQIDYEEASQIEGIYKYKFEEIFGYPPTRKIEIYSIRLHLGCPEPVIQKEEFCTPAGKCILQKSCGNLLQRSDLEAGDKLIGPCLIVDNYGTLQIEEGWSGIKGNLGSLLLEKNEVLVSDNFNHVVTDELFASRFFCLVEEMGVQLRRTALSVNVRDRLDFSCALMDGDGYLVANAPHIPVHLGALGLCVRETVKFFPNLQKGDIIITNHPAFGGSHLPDVTIIAPIFSQDNRLIAYLANRAHHAEIGGVSPGSMPAGTNTLLEEGVVIHPCYLFKSGQSKMNEIAELLRQAKYPTRQLVENMADLSAQVASIRQGSKELSELENEYSREVLIKQMKNIQSVSEKSCTTFFMGWGDCQLNSVQCLDDGDELRLQITIKNGSAIFDFSGTASCRSDNLNATEAITNSAVCYCLRLLINKNLPLNEGLLRPVHLIIPKGSILAPNFSNEIEKCPGVAGGNVEISQKLVDLILGCFQKVAGSQGTMNNVTFGNSSYSHYETIAGGAGAMIGFDGTSAVQVHMTNTSITDPEILESRFPVRLTKFRIRKKSGGVGSWNGGDGVEREFFFEQESEICLLTQNRKSSPLGIAGGLNGKTGEQFIVRKDGTTQKLSSIDSAIAQVGDRLIIRTPGGGGAGEQEIIA